MWHYHSGWEAVSATDGPTTGWEVVEATVALPQRLGDGKCHWWHYHGGWKVVDAAGDTTIAAGWRGWEVVRTAAVALPLRPLPSLMSADRFVYAYDSDCLFQTCGTPAAVHGGQRRGISELSQVPELVPGGIGCLSRRCGGVHGAQHR